jgi:hypothetical protein
MTNWGAIFSMLLLSLAASLFIFVFFQRYLVEGIAVTGLKGQTKIGIIHEIETRMAGQPGHLGKPGVC